MQGAGATVGYSLASSGFTPLTGVISITTPQFKNVPVETTDLSSVAMEFEPGACRDNGEFTFEVKYDSFTGPGAAWGTPAGQTLYYWQISYGSGLSFIFRGFVKSMETEFKTNNLIVWKIAVKVSGAVTADWTD